MIKKFLGVALLFSLQSSILFGMDNPDAVKDVDDIPRFCTNLMTQLLAQNAYIWKHVGPTTEMCKSLQIQSLDDGKICAFLNRNSRLKLEIYAERRFDGNSPLAVDIITFWLPNKQYTRMFANDPDYSILCQLFQRDALETCPPETLALLTHEYEEFLEHLKNGWIYSSMENYDGLKPPVNENWIHYIKKESPEDSAMFIMNLIMKFKFYERVWCSGSIYCSPEFTGFKESIHLWVKKEVLPEFDRIFKFKTVTGQLLGEIK